MSPKSIILSLLLCISSTLAQLSPFFGGFPVHIATPFSDFGSVGGGSQFPGEGGGRSNTGPILFPPAPESRDTSGVIVGASGYGFVPPGSASFGPSKTISQSRGLPPSFGSFGSQFGQPFFHL